MSDLELQFKNYALACFKSIFRGYYNVYIGFTTDDNTHTSRDKLGKFRVRINVQQLIEYYTKPEVFKASRPHRREMEPGNHPAQFMRLVMLHERFHIHNWDLSVHGEEYVIEKEADEYARRYLC